MKKQELRTIFKAKRDALNQIEKEKMEQAIYVNLFEGINFSPIKSVHCFLPATSKNEINTWPIIGKLRTSYPQISIVVPETNIQNNSLTSRLLLPDTIVKENKWGIPEPVNAKAFDNSQIDLVLLPLLAVDTHGNRVGYGKGFYDQFLITCKPDIIKVGLSLFPPVDLIEDYSTFDIPLNKTISPIKMHIHI